VVEREARYHRKCRARIRIPEGCQNLSCTPPGCPSVPIRFRWSRASRLPPATFWNASGVPVTGCINRSVSKSDVSADLAAGLPVILRVASPPVALIVQASFQRDRRATKPANRSFSATNRRHQARRQNFLRPSLLFPSESHPKSCGKSCSKSCMEIMCKRCGKSIDFLRISPRKPVENSADNLRISSGIPAEKPTKSRLLPVDLNI